jgi:hypothetical protein
MVAFANHIAEHFLTCESFTGSGIGSLKFLSNGSRTDERLSTLVHPPKRYMEMPLICGLSRIKLAFICKPGQ